MISWITGNIGTKELGLGKIGFGARPDCSGDCPHDDSGQEMRKILLRRELRALQSLHGSAFQCTESSQIKNLNEGQA